MQRPIVTLAVALGLACVGSAPVAARQPALERHTVNLPNGFGLTALIAHSPAEFARAQLEATRQEGRRHVGVGPQTVYTMAIHVDELQRIIATTPAPTGSGVQAFAPGTNLAGGWER